MSHTILLTFAFVGGGPGNVRSFVDVKDITSNELRDLRLGFLLEMEFTYTLRQLDVFIISNIISNS